MYWIASFSNQKHTFYWLFDTTHSVTLRASHLFRCITCWAATPRFIPRARALAEAGEAENTRPCWTFSNLTAALVEPRTSLVSVYRDGWLG